MSDTSASGERNAPLLPPPRPRRKPWHRARLVRLALGLGLALFVSAVLLFNPHARYEHTHDLPNPYWGLFNGEYSYTPPQGPPGAGLVDSRPERIVVQYIHDYISVAGTFPCASSLADYPARLEGGDPVLLGHGCTVRRTVASVTVLSVWVHRFGAELDYYTAPKATVRYRVTYTNGEAFEGTLTLAPMESQRYFLTYIHLTCWQSLDTLLLYPDIVPYVPSGVRYESSSGAFKCMA